MKALSLIVVLAAVFAAAFWWFRRQEPKPTPVVVPASAAADPHQAEREQWFGEQASAPGIEWRESGLGFRIESAGTPPKPGIGQAVRLKYVGRLKDGTVFDQSDTPSQFLIGATIPGLSTGLQMLGAGGKATFYIPPSLGYGNRKVMGIPPGSGLIFEVELVSLEAQ